MDNKLIIKDVEFNGAILRAAQDEESKIWVGVRWVCEGIGFSGARINTERKRIQMDVVLSKGGRYFDLPTNGGEQSILCLQLEYLPLWLRFLYKGIIINHNKNRANLH